MHSSQEAKIVANVFTCVFLSETTDFKKVLTTTVIHAFHAYIEYKVIKWDTIKLLKKTNNTNRLNTR